MRSDSDFGGGGGGGGDEFGFDSIYSGGEKPGKVSVFSGMGVGRSGIPRRVKERRQTIGCDAISRIGANGTLGRSVVGGEDAEPIQVKRKSTLTEINYDTLEAGKQQQIIVCIDKKKSGAGSGGGDSRRPSVLATAVAAAGGGGSGMDLKCAGGGGNVEEAEVDAEEEKEKEKEKTLWGRLKRYYKNKRKTNLILNVLFQCFQTTGLMMATSIPLYNNKPALIWGSIFFTAMASIISVIMGINYQKDNEKVLLNLILQNRGGEEEEEDPIEDHVLCGETKDATEDAPSEKELTAARELLAETEILPTEGGEETQQWGDSVPFAPSALHSRG